MSGNRKEGAFSRLPFLKDRITRMFLAALAIGAIVFWITYMIYERVNLFTDYSVISSAEENDVDGTLYRILGEHVIKYSHDGVFCVTMNNTTVWSNAFSMQTPISDVRGNYMALAEQQGNQVYVITETGIAGSFKTDMPIIKISVSASGETAVILDDSDAAWINLYRMDGTLVASVKSTVSGSGYPMDIALSGDARQMMVSFVHPGEKKIEGSIGFYDFSSAADADEMHLKNRISYTDMIFPEVYYTASGSPVAISDEGFVNFTQEEVPVEKSRLTLDDEIVSVFHENTHVGFIVRSNENDVLYNMSLYNLRAQEVMSVALDFSYENVKMENGEIMLSEASNIYLYRTSGRQKLDAEYKGNVNYFASLGDTRRYLIISDHAMERIRIS